MRIFHVRGTCCLLLAAFAGCSWLKPPRTSKFILYPVRRGDTLHAIGERFFVPVSDLQDANDIDDPRRLLAGTTLRVPFNGEAWQQQKTPAAQAQVQVASASSRSPARPIANRLGLGEASQYVGALQWPVARGELSSRFGWRWLNFHEGIDIRAPSGTPIYAAHAGQVVYSGNGLRGYGNLVIVRGEGLLTIYAHNHRNRVRTGQTVRKGAHIADVGSTGKSTGPHLHFETRVKDARGKNAAVDPLVFFESA